MDPKSIKKQVSQIKQIAEAILKEIDADLPVLPAEANRKMAQGICLQCGEKIPKGEKKIRGLHASCHRTAARAVESGEVTWDELIRSGLAAQAQSGGRPRKVVRRK